MKRKRLVLLSLAIILGVFSLITAYTLNKYPYYYIRIKSYVKSVLKDNGIGNTMYNSKIKNDRYSLHRGSAVTKGVSLIEDNKLMEKQLDNGNLVRVEKGKGYRIHRLNHSEAVLHKKAKEILNSIGEDFYNKTNQQHYFTVTSLTRTVESHKQLAKYNINATKGISTHCYGVSFDISYIRFDGKKRGNAKLQGVLEDVLLSYQKQKKIYVIRETVSNCYHVTIR